MTFDDSVNKTLSSEHYWIFYLATPAVAMVHSRQKNERRVISSTIVERIRVPKNLKEKFKIQNQERQTVIEKNASFPNFPRNLSWETDLTDK